VRTTQHTQINYVHTYVRTYIYTHTHTHIHTHKRTDIQHIQHSYNTEYADTHYIPDSTLQVSDHPLWV
jgi:hypothetical protein